MISYICVLLDQLQDLRATPDILEEVLDLMLGSFEKSVLSLSLKRRKVCDRECDRNCGVGCDMDGPVHMPSLRGSSHNLSIVTNQTREENCNSMKAVDDITIDADEDIGWFFSDDITPTTAETSPPLVDTPTPPLLPVSTASAPLSCDPISVGQLDIWRGLEHCLRWDFNTSFDENNDNSYRLSFPMKIALSATSHILAQDLSSTENIKPIPLKTHSPLLKGMSFEWIQGKSIGDTALYEDTVIEFCEHAMVNRDKARQGGGMLESPHVAAQGARVYASYQQAVETLTAIAQATGGPPVVGLQHVAVVDMAVRTDDKSTVQLRVSGNGSSEQADALHHQVSHIHHSTTPEEAFDIIQQLNRKESYIEQALAHLLSLSVQVLLCPYSVPLKLLDACFENGICVVPMSTDNLHIMAKLTQADIMEDILDLYPECLGCKCTTRNDNMPSGCVQIELRDCVKRVLSDEPNSIYKSQLSVMLLLHVRRDTTMSGCGVESSPSNKSLKGTRNTPYANSSSLRAHREGKRHVSVLILCPTAVMGSITEDRIRKCVSRIDLVLRGEPPRLPVDNSAQLLACPGGSSWNVLGQVVSGGGMVELLCSMYIQEFKNNHTPDVSAAVLYADKLTQSMQDFVYTVNTNNGQTPGAALSKWHRCVEDIKNKHKVWTDSTAACMSGGGGGDSTKMLAEFVACLDVTHLMNLLRPIVIDEDDGSVVLDVASLKIETMRVACFAVKSILRTSFIISLS